MHTNIVTSAAAIAMLGTVCGACTFQTEEDRTGEESVAEAAATLPADAGASFEHIVTLNIPVGKTTNICELTLPNMDPTAGAEIVVGDVVDGMDNYTISAAYHWTGADIEDYTFPKPKDRVEITGCNTGGDCRLTIRITSKGNDCLGFHGCFARVEAPYGQPTVGYQGYTYGDYLMTASFSDPRTWVTAQGRQKMYTDLGWAGLTHQCTSRIFEATGATGMEAGVGYEFNGADFGSATNSMGAPEPVPAFPTLLNPSGLPGRWAWGTDSSSTRVKHILPPSVGLVPGDWVWCQSYVTVDGSTGLDQAKMNYDQDAVLGLVRVPHWDDDRPGMVLRTYTPPLPL